jgi:aspartyl-tRNA(Asn)/glutamyl-tRNA(Gln) amidotransferase subunit B
VEILTASRETADYFEAVVDAGAPAGEAANWIQGTVLRVLNETKLALADLKVSPNDLAELIGLIQDGTISRSIAREVFDDMAESGSSAGSIVESRGLRQISDTGELETVVEQVVGNHPNEAGRYRGGDKKLLGFFMGNVMKATQGKANPKLASELLRRTLDS